MATSLTKTQRELLAEAIGRRSGLCFTHHGVITGRKKGSYGARRTDAAIKLRDAGMLEREASYQNSTRLIGAFSGTDHSYESTWRITEVGRVAIL